MFYSICNLLDFHPTCCLLFLSSFVCFSICCLADCPLLQFMFLMKINCVAPIANWIPAIFSLYRIVLAPRTLKPFRTGLLYTHKNGGFGAISVTERRCAAMIVKVDHHISDRPAPLGSVAEVNNMVFSLRIK